MSGLAARTATAMKMAAQAVLRCASGCSRRRPSNRAKRRPCSTGDHERRIEAQSGVSTRAFGPAADNVWENAGHQSHQWPGKAPERAHDPPRPGLSFLDLPEGVLHEIVVLLE